MGNVGLRSVLLRDIILLLMFRDWILFVALFLLLPEFGKRLFASILIVSAGFWSSNGFDSKLNIRKAATGVR